MTRIALIIGNPLPDSLDHGLAHSYRIAAEQAGAEVRVIDLAEQRFDPTPPDRESLRVGEPEEVARLGPAIQSMIETVLWAEHLIFVYPVWWGTYPAVLKGFFDRVFLSGIAYRYRSQGAGWDRLLAGRTARLVMTMDAPSAFNRLKYRRAGEISLKNPILWYCGIRTIGTTRFDKVRFSTPEQRQKWLQRMARLGAKDAARSRRTEPLVTAGV